MEPASYSGMKLLLQEFTSINKRALYEDNQVTLEFPNGEGDVRDLRVILKPNFGPFQGARIPFRFKLPANYPLSAPTVRCEAKLYHPNVSLTGSVCFSMFSNDFDSRYRLEHYINGLLWLLNNPNPDSALNAKAIVRDSKVFYSEVRHSLMGNTIKGTSYAKLLHSQHESEFNIVNDLFSEFTSLPAFVPASRLLKDITESSYLNKFVEPLLEVQFGKLPGTMKRISQAHKALGVDPKLLLKELLFTIDEKFILVISHGYDLIDISWLTQVYKGSSCRLTSASEITKFSCNHDSLPALRLCHIVHEVLVNESLVNMEENTFVYTTMGYVNLLLKIHIGLFLKSLSKDNVKILPFKLTHNSSNPPIKN